jgi:hypothetical protein
MAEPHDFVLPGKRLDNSLFRFVGVLKRSMSSIAASLAPP